ncbi:peroxiredoxin [Aquabacter spiritensis]|uniref:thioredoxin-dependent peroxiredoxin n=1 Tax=Aquabacter spiritensis TaxID=933073 RepID=A0A4R3M0W0_9HYPH|nr:peroxiredoxin [Aquabacter spiritensis]TCT04725.1 peroxiredoxin Q/BCP [Aquabacter spiritensis]
MAQLPTPGSKAPDFRLKRDGGGDVSLADFAGRKLVLYFYPKANTEGCTKEAIAFNGLRAEFAAAGTALLGVSADPVAALDRFKTKQGLDFPLATDEGKAMLEAYGVWVEKSMYGKTYMGIQRATLLIDATGTVAQSWPNVKVAGHAEDVLAAARAL